MKKALTFSLLLCLPLTLLAQTWKRDAQGNWLARTPNSGGYQFIAPVRSISGPGLQLVNGILTFTGSASGTSGVTSYTALTDRPVIPVVPTLLSAFTNDPGYALSSDVTTLVNQRVLLTNYNTFVTSQDARDDGQDTDISSRVLTTTYNNERSADQASATNADNLSSGTLPDARLNNIGTAGTVGGGTTIISATTTDAKGRTTTRTTIDLNAMANSINFTAVGTGIIFRTPDNTKSYRLGVDNNGNLTTTLIP